MARLQDVDTRVTTLLDQMTLDEKIAQIGGMWAPALVDDDCHFSPEKTAHAIPHGIGHITRVGGSIRLRPRDNARLTNAIQRWTRDHTRLGIPIIIHEESVAGYLAREATTFPQAIGMAASFDPALIRAVGNVIRQQIRTSGGHHALAPVLDVVRDARWGRCEETFGEDPFLVARMSVAYIQGIQSDDLTQGVAATAKHFIGYSASEGGMNWAPAHIGPRELREIFAYPFAAAIQEAAVASVMNAYHELDGEPCGGSSAIMMDLLRDELGFDGVVVSDYRTLETLVTYHQVARDQAEAARLGLNAGIDVELPLNKCYGQPLRDALEKGDIRIDAVDDCVKRVLRSKFELGLFDNPFVDEDAVSLVFEQSRDKNRTLSYEVARKSIVLLKNDGVLPLDPTQGTIALIGPHAANPRLMQGDYHYPSHIETLFTPEAQRDKIEPNPIIAPTTDGTFDDHIPPTITLYDALQATYGDRLMYAQGCTVRDEDTSGFDTAKAIAEQSDVIIVAVGDKSGLSSDDTSGEANDRASLHLPGVQLDLIQMLHATGKPVIVILYTGRAVALPWMSENVAAILQAWLPAEMGGQAIGDTLVGTANPGGRLPVSFPRSVGQMPMFYNHKPSGGRANWKGHYTDLPATPIYAFGHGLSYTSFIYSDLQIDKPILQTLDTVKVSAIITNSGNRSGEEVVQLYIRDVVGSLSRPVKQLKGFTRLHLNPGESKRVRFVLDTAQFGFYIDAAQFVVEPGDIRIMFGDAADQIYLEGEVTIVGEVTETKPVFTTPTSIEVP